jgi:hypothetical protein
MQSNRAGNSALEPPAQFWSSAVSILHKEAAGLALTHMMRRNGGRTGGSHAACVHVMCRQRGAVAGSGNCRCGRRHLEVVVHHTSQASSISSFVHKCPSEILPRPALRSSVTRQRGNSGRGPRTCAPLPGIQAVAQGSFKLEIQLTSANGTLRDRARNPLPASRADSRRTRSRRTLARSQTGLACVCVLVSECVCARARLPRHIARCLWYAP